MARRRAERLYGHGHRPGLHGDKRKSKRRKIMMKSRMYTMLFAIFVTAVSAVAATMPGGLSFSNTPLLLSKGSSEPEIGFNGNFMAIVSLGWLFPFGTQLWTGNFGSTPDLQGAIDSALTKAGFAVVFGGSDADVNVGSTGAMHATTLVVP